MTIRPEAVGTTRNEPPPTEGSMRTGGEAAEFIGAAAHPASEREEENESVTEEGTPARKATVLVVAVVCLSFVVPLALAASIPQMPDWLDFILENFPEIGLGICGILALVCRLVGACRGETITLKEQLLFFGMGSQLGSLILPMISYLLFNSTFGNAVNKAELDYLALCVAAILAVCAAFGIHSSAFLFSERYGWPIPVLSAKVHAGGWIVGGVYFLFKVIKPKSSGGTFFVASMYTFFAFSSCKYAQCLVRLREMSSPLHGEEGSEEVSRLLDGSAPLIVGEGREWTEACLDEMHHLTLTSRDSLQSIQRGRLVLTSRRLIFLSTGLDTFTYPPTSCLGLSALSNAGSKTWDLESIDRLERVRTLDNLRAKGNVGFLKLHLLRGGMVAIFGITVGPHASRSERENELEAFVNQTTEEAAQIQLDNRP